MKTAASRKIIPFVLILASVVCAYAYQVDISADNLQYDQNCGIITAEGNVVLVWQDKEVKSDYVEFLIEEKIMNAMGHVRIEEDGNSFFAESITYKYDDETGEIRESMAYSSIIFMRSKSMDRKGKNTFAVNNITISNCDLDEPHAYFKSKKGKITLNERVTIYNAVFYIGKIPIFYLPIVTKSLKGGKGISSKFIYGAEPGFTNNGGISVKSFVQYQFTDSFKGKAVLDYYGTRGWGYGTEFDYYSSNAKGTIYAYYIKDLTAGYNRWTLRPNYWHKINKNWTIQSQAELISDESFNNYYNDDWNRVMSTLHSYFSITRQGKSTNLLIAADRVDTYDSIKGDYETTSITLPKVTFNIYPKKILWDLVNNFTFNYANMYKRYTAVDPFYKNTVDATYTVARDFKFGRKFTLKPSLGITENWYDKDDYGNEDNSFNTRYFATLNSRLRVTRWMDWNLAYNVRIRSARNSFKIDDDSNEHNDYGIETNSLSFTNYMYIGNRTTVRNFTSYNFVDYKTVQPVRWSPLTTEIIYTPKHYMTVYLKQTQSISPFLFKSAQLDITLGEIEKVYFNLGVFYQYYDEKLNPSMAYRNQEIDNIIGFGLWLNPKWRLDYNIRITSRIDKIYSRMNEHEFKIYRDMHCYNFGLTWKIRGIYHEVFFKFDLKTNMPFSRTSDVRRQVDANESAEIFYPWR
ncbi:MAG: hypothetical protein LBD46_03635 [Endomicrobium sp.]|jgi:LPS-assembly protein|nr:hypothetical protein [Endomicrobium sp.]